jgi:hypothetical protein
MNLADLERKLIAAARRHPPDDRVPHAFAKRITALIGARAVPDYWAFWAHGLWRAAAACFVIAMLLGVFSLLHPARPAKSMATAVDLSEEFENTMLADVNQETGL